MATSRTSWKTNLWIYFSSKIGVNYINQIKFGFTQSVNKTKIIIDKQFDKLHEQKRIKWISTVTPFSFPSFVVWTNVNGIPKKRMVIDIRALNKITIPDIYLVPFQTEILFQIKNSKYISTVNAANFFYQWWITKPHRHRLIIYHTVGKKRLTSRYGVP